MQCHHFDAGECRSCTLLPLPRSRQVGEASARIEQLLAPHLAGDLAGAGAPGAVWGPPLLGAESGFRARGKMAVSGTAQHPVLGLPGQSASADLSDCPLYPDGAEAVLEGVKALVRRAQVPPYNVEKRRGELKNVLVTTSPDGEHAVRLVLRSETALPRIREHLPRLLEQCPSIVMVTANLHPEHTTRVEGETELPLWGAASIGVRTGDVVLRARPGSFLQTHTEVAGQLYRQGAAWIREVADARRAAAPAAPLRDWDLYCGLGGFALHTALALPDAEVTGVEVTPEAIDGAREAAAASGLSAQFLTDDATAWAAREAEGPAGPPHVVVVNPPRRGIGTELAAWIEDSGVADVVYSSCNPATLATDLAAMPSLRIVAGRFVDMFPHTEHAEVIVRLRHVPAAAPVGPEGETR